MTDKRLIILSVTAIPLPGCGVAMDGSPYYCVEVFIPIPDDQRFADAITPAINEMSGALTQRKLMLRDIDKAFIFDPDEWDPTAPLVGDAIRAQMSGHLGIGSLRSPDLDVTYRIQLTDPDGD